MDLNGNVRWDEQEGFPSKAAAPDEDFRHELHHNQYSRGRSCLNRTVDKGAQEKLVAAGDVGRKNMQGMGGVKA